ncbi:hypothetical protein [Acrocarpospora catenulata]|uniref:hypothetical protein n=1 Tax=Acrocarpospora catenulata TaxID=2836182 RepID=UPI001BD9A512|nr:hypothetical protein [Acrocarpospora catenulata]
MPGVEENPPELCGTCFPAGLDSQPEGATVISCAHGAWRVEDLVKQEPKEPPPDNPEKTEGSESRGDNAEHPCPEHFPAGFTKGVFSACCEHGLWYAPAELPADGSGERVSPGTGEVMVAVEGDELVGDGSGTTFPPAHSDGKGDGGQ